jgi:hypothetical protein
MMPVLAARLVALIALVGCAAATLAYPLNPLFSGAFLGTYMALLWWRPHLWLAAVPALLPVLDLAPWTGWFFLEELDLLLAATVAVGYWRLAPVAPQARLPRFAAAALAMITLAFALSGAAGVLPLAPFDANAFANYMSPYNSLRIAKGLLWALLLLPLLTRCAGPELQNLQKYFVPGMLLGLAGTCAAVAWERTLFPGLINFSSDYRPTAPFSAMHTGGAALDAYLALSFPFVAAWLLAGGGRLRRGAALMLLLVGLFTGLATFSRDMYLAYSVSATVLGVILLSQHLRSGQLRLGMLLGVGTLLALAGWLLAGVFGSSGYRGLAAALALLGSAALLAGSEPRGRPYAMASAAALSLLLAGAVLIQLAAKGVYLAFGLALVFSALGSALLLWGPAAHRRAALALAAGAFPAMLVFAPFVATHWGGAGALDEMLYLGLMALGVVALNHWRVAPPWRNEGSAPLLIALCGIVFAMAIPLSGSYYSGERFATVGSDIDVRLGHWNEAFAMMAPDWHTAAIGMGLGSYPRSYFWLNTHGETPGNFSYHRDKEGNQLLRLGAPHYERGFGEVLRMLQQVDVKAGQHYQLAFDVRRSAGDATLGAAVCKRWLIFPEHCVHAPVKLAPADGAWHHYSLPLQSDKLSDGASAAPVRLELSANGDKVSLDIDNVSLRDSKGQELLRNGRFEAGHDWWFFSSDRNHFPWHAKNFVVNTYFEMGWFGIATLGMLGLYAAGTLLARGLGGELYASVSLAALAGFMMVGLFDSLFDVPRLTLIFFLVLCTACLRRRKQRVRRASTPDTEAATV